MALIDPAIQYSDIADEPNARRIRDCPAFECKDAPAFHRPIAGCDYRPATANGKALKSSAPLIPVGDYPQKPLGGYGG